MPDRSPIDDELADLSETIAGAATAPAIVVTMVAVVLAIIVLLAVRFG